jgi:CRP-like cAMP-binding protein
MGTLFAGPEETVVKQGDTADRIYFIVQGDCTVDMVDHDRTERHAFKILVEGNMFGEISLLYNCPRTASIVSKNYNTMGCILDQRFKDLVGEYPELKMMLEKHVFTYMEPKKMFYYKNLLKVEYFKGISTDIFHKLFFRFEPIALDPGDVLLYEGDETNQLFVVEKGLLEMYVEMDNHEFVLEYLRPGSVLNHTVVFMTDLMVINIRAVENSVVSYVMEADLEQLKTEDKLFDKKISQYQLNLYKKKRNRFPLDIILSADDKLQEMRNKVMTIVKNVVMNIILEVKVEKAKPKLQDILRIFKGKDKQFVANKLRLIYSKPEEGGS